MAENYKHLYEQMKKALIMYQDEIVPGMRKVIEDLEKPKWIQVTEMVPESHVEPIDDIDGIHYVVISDFVLGYTDKGECMVVQHEVGDERDWWLDYGGTYHTITHWMPLPEAPKGE